VDDLEVVLSPAARNAGHRFAAALAAKDGATPRAIPDAEADFGGRTPNRVWEARTAAAVADDVILGKWFEPGDGTERVEAVETGPAGDRCRLQGTDAEGRFAVEQHAFSGVADNKITWLRMMCSGFRPAAARP